MATSHCSVHSYNVWEGVSSDSVLSEAFSLAALWGILWVQKTEYQSLCCSKQRCPAPAFYSETAEPRHAAPCMHLFDHSTGINTEYGDSFSNQTNKWLRIKKNVLCAYNNFYAIFKIWRQWWYLWLGRIQSCWWSLVSLHGKLVSTAMTLLVFLRCDLPFLFCSLARLFL